MADRMSELVVEIAERKAALKEYSKAERQAIKDLQVELEAIAKSEQGDEEDD